MKQAVKFPGLLMLVAILAALLVACGPMPTSTPAETPVAPTRVPTDASALLTPIPTGKPITPTSTPIDIPQPMPTPTPTPIDAPQPMPTPMPMVQTPVTTILLVRHAERLDDTLDTPLSEEGRSRAQTLVHVAAEAGVTAIYASEFTRTHQTVQPLAAYLDLPVNHVNADDVEGLVEEVLMQHAGEVVMIAGHSPTVPAIIAQLRGDSAPAPSLTGYDDLFVVTHSSSPDQPGDEVSVVNLQYGNPSGPGLGGSPEYASRMTTVLLVPCPEDGNAGVERAKALAHVVANARMTAMYVPTREAVQLPPDYRGPEPTTYNSNDIQGLLDQVVSDHVGEVVGIAAENDTLFEIIERFGGSPLLPTSPNEYDRLFVITVYEPSKAKTVSLQYGDPSP